MFVTYYTSADLNGDVGGYVELLSIQAHGQVFIDWDDYIVAWAHQGEVQEAA